MLHLKDLKSAPGVKGARHPDGDTRIMVDFSLLNFLGITFFCLFHLYFYVIVLILFKLKLPFLISWINEVWNAHIRGYSFLL